MTKISVFVSLSETVDALKGKIEVLGHVPVSKQTLVFTAFLIFVFSVVVVFLKSRFWVERS